MTENARPFQPVEDVCRVEVRYTQDDAKVENTLYFRNTVGWDNGSLTTLANIVYDNWVAHFKPLQHPSVSMREIVCTQLEAPIDLQYTFAAPVGSVGTASGDPMPNNVTICVSFRTGLAGRSARGRNYFIGITKQVVAANTVNAATINALVAGYNALKADATAETFTWGIVQRWANKVWLTEGIFRPISTVVVVDATVDSQRRRLPGRGQ